MKVTTKKGYDFFEATSAFQKAIRRGDETTALYFMVEFWNSGYEKYLWKRIRVITSEDVGLASPGMPAIIHALYQSYWDVEKENKLNRPERMFMTHAVVALCRAPKSRLVDYQLVKIWREHDSVKLEIPDYAYDMHNFKGKQMKRGIDHFYDDGTLLENYKAQPGEDKIKEQAKHWHAKVPGKLKFEAKKRANKSEQSAMFEDEED